MTNKAINVRQLLIDSGINAPGADLLAESFLRSPVAKIMFDMGEPLKFFLPIQRVDCQGWVGVDITISAVDKFDKKEPGNPLTPQEWWSLAPWQPMESAPTNGSILIKNVIGGAGYISYESAEMRKYSFETTNAIAWIPLPVVKL